MTATATHPMTRNFPGDTRCAIDGCGLTRSAKVHKVQKAAVTGAIATVTVTETAEQIADLYAIHETDDLVRDAASYARHAVADFAKGDADAVAFAHEGTRRAAALAQRADAPADGVPAVFAAQVAAILATTETEPVAAEDAPTLRWADRQRAPEKVVRTPEQQEAACAAQAAAYTAQIAAEHAARIAELAAGPVPEGALWVYDTETGEKAGWLSADVGVVRLAAPAARMGAIARGEYPATPAPAVEEPVPAVPAYITLPAGTSLPERGALPEAAVVVLARSEFWDSKYRTSPDPTMHIAGWGLAVVALCRTRLVNTEGRESYLGRDGQTYWKDSRRPDLAGRTDARFGYATDTDCDGCRREFAKETREGLPSDLRYRMIAQRRTDRESRAEAARTAAAAASADQLTLDQGPTTEAEAAVIAAAEAVIAEAIATEAKKACGADATRANHQGHGAPASGVYYGRIAKPDRNGELVTIDRDGRSLTLRNAAGDQVDTFDSATMFWLLPITATPSPAEVADAAPAAAHYDATNIANCARWDGYHPTSTSHAPRTRLRLLRSYASMLAYNAARVHEAGHHALGAAIEARLAGYRAEIDAAAQALARGGRVVATVTAPAVTEEQTGQLCLAWPAPATTRPPRSPRRTTRRPGTGTRPPRRAAAAAPAAPALW